MPTRNEALRLGGLLLLCFLMFFFRLGGHLLWDIDEGMHAVTSKNMVTTGDWVVPTFNGEAFFDKPPLYNWLGAAAFQLLGFTEFAARLPSALLGLAGVLATYLFGRRMFGARAALLSAIVLATSLEYFVLSRAVVHDIALAFFVALTLFAFYRAYDEERHRARYLSLSYVAAGCAILAKGPVGLLLPGAVIALFLGVRRDPGFLRKMMLVRGALIVTAIAAPWYLLVSRQDESFLSYFLLHQNLANFASSEARHAQPFHYYLPIVILGFLPWSFYLLLALVRWIRRWSRDTPAHSFAILWFLFVLVFFSAASSKLPTYILPLFPAGALLVGALWDRMLGPPEKILRRGVLAAHLASLVLAFAAVAYLWFSVRTNPEIGPKLPGWAVPATAGVILAGVAVTSFCVARRNYRSLFCALSGVVVATILFFTLVIAPGLDPFKSSKTIALHLDGLLAPGEKMAIYRWVKDSGMFYTGREAQMLESQEELRDHLARAGALCIIDERRLDDLDIVDEIRRSSRVELHYGNKLILEGLGVSADSE